MYKLVLFDLDGTLLDTDLLLVLTWTDLYKKYRPNDIPRLDEVVKFSGPPIKESLANTFPNVDLDVLYKDFNETSRPYYDKYVTTYPYGKELIKELKNRGIKVGVVSSKHRIPALHSFDLVGLSDAFDIVITADDVSKQKPSPEGILKALSTLSLDKKDVLYIGDNTVDYLTAKGAGVDVMLVTWGPRKLDKNITPTYYIDDYRNFFEVIKDGNN